MTGDFRLSVVVSTRVELYWSGESPRSASVALMIFPVRPSGGPPSVAATPPEVERRLAPLPPRPSLPPCLGAPHGVRPQ